MHLFAKMHTLSKLQEIKLFSLANFLQIEELIKPQKKKFKEFLPILFKSQKIRQIEAKGNHFVFPKVVFYAAQTWKTELNQVRFSRMAFQYFCINHF